MLNTLSLGWSTWSSATHASTEHLREDIAVAASATLLDSLLTVLVVEVSLISVREHIVSGCHLFEFLWITTFIWMLLERLLSVSPPI